MAVGAVELAASPIVFLNDFINCPALWATENYFYALVQEVHEFLKSIVDTVSSAAR